MLINLHYRSFARARVFLALALPSCLSLFFFTLTLILWRYRNAAVTLVPPGNFPGLTAKIRMVKGFFDFLATDFDSDMRREGRVKERRTNPGRAKTGAAPILARPSFCSQYAQKSSHNRRFFRQLWLFSSH
jgi:hypothetical protein